MIDSRFLETKNSIIKELRPESIFLGFLNLFVLFFFNHWEKIWSWVPHIWVNFRLIWDFLWKIKAILRTKGKYRENNKEELRIKNEAKEMSIYIILKCNGYLKNKNQCQKLFPPIKERRARLDFIQGNFFQDKSTKTQMPTNLEKHVQNLQLHITHSS
jgi:hypothetical protein